MELREMHREVDKFNNDINNIASKFKEGKICFREAKRLIDKSRVKLIECMDKFINTTNAFEE